MSKMSELHRELSEQAYDLGFQSLDDALNKGYEVDYDNARLIKVDQQELAHKEWLKEKEEVLDELKRLHEYFVEEDDLHYSIVVAKAIKLIEEGEF